MLKLLDGFEKTITYVLILLMIVVVAFATIELAWAIVQGLLSPPTLLLEANELLDVFGLFLLVLVILGYQTRQFENLEVGD